VKRRKIGNKKDFFCAIYSFTLFESFSPPTPT
jgi:hypothetical protein